MVLVIWLWICCERFEWKRSLWSRIGAQRVSAGPPGGVVLVLAGWPRTDRNKSVSAPRRVNAASVAEYKGLSRDGLGLAFTPVHRVVGGRCLTPVQPTSRSNHRALLQRARLWFMSCSTGNWTHPAVWHGRTWWLPYYNSCAVLSLKLIKKWRAGKPHQFITLLFCLMSITYIC